MGRLEIPQSHDAFQNIGIISGTDDSGNIYIINVDSEGSIKVRLANVEVSNMIPAVETGLAKETGGHLSSIDTKLVSGTDIGDVTINNATGAAAVNIQDGGNTITVDGSVGVSSLPSIPHDSLTASDIVSLPASQITTLTPPAAITNFANETGGNLASIKGKTDNLDILLSALRDAITTAIGNVLQNTKVANIIPQEISTYEPQISINKDNVGLVKNTNLDETNELLFQLLLEFQEFKEMYGGE